MRLRPVALLLGCLLVVGCNAGREDRATSTPVRSPKLDFELVKSPPAVQGQCRRTAKHLGYAVPCPGLLPSYSDPTPVADPTLSNSPFVDYYVRPGFRGYRRWMFLTVDFPSAVRPGHLVISASPRLIDALHFMSLQPSPFDRVKRVDQVRFRGRTAQVIRVLVSDGSIFQHHTVLLWAEGGHTYGVGFHGLDKEAERLNLEVARSIRLVGP